MGSLTQGRAHRLHGTQLAPPMPYLLSYGKLPSPGRSRFLPPRSVLLTALYTPTSYNDFFAVTNTVAPLPSLSPPSPQPVPLLLQVVRLPLRQPLRQLRRAGRLGVARGGGGLPRQVQRAHGVQLGRWVGGKGVLSERGGNKMKLGGGQAAARKH